MIEILDANAVFRQSLNRLDPAKFQPRIFYEKTCSSKVPQLWVWDGSRHNDRRRALFPGYKIRDYTGQENIFAGLDLYRELLLYSPAIQIEVPEWEADDVCAALARHYAGRGEPVTVHTIDFDFYQLLTDPLITLRGVRPIEGVEPRHVSAYKALRGDASDKIPGIEGFGPKSWDALAGLHDEVDRALAERDADAIRALPFKPKIRLWLSLDENIDLIFTYYEITRLMSVPLDLIEKHSYPGTHNPVAAETVFQRFFL